MNDDPQVVWEPRSEYHDGSRLERVMGLASCSDYDAFYALSIEEPDRFWSATLAELGVEWFQPYDQFVDLSQGPQWPRWFVGGRINVTHNAVDRWLGEGDAQTALIGIDEGGATTTTTRAELAAAVRAFAGFLRTRGVGRGDRVALFLPFIPEAAVALLAVAHVGAVAVPIFSGYGYDAVGRRIRDAGATAVITADGFSRKGRHIPLRSTLDRALADCPGVTTVVVVEHLGDAVGRRTDGEWSWTSALAVHADGGDPEPMTPDDPLLIAFTSGTTGRPKGAVHTHAGLPLKLCQEMTQLMDIGPGSTLLRVTDLGWVGGPYTILSGLMAGATIAMYSGAPTHPAEDAIWALVERHRVTHLGIAPTLARMMRPAGAAAVRAHDIDSLRMTATTGEPWDEETYLWYAGAVGDGRLPIINHSGGTEVGNLLGCVPVRPIRACSFNTAVPGIALAVLGGDGERLTERQGDLVVERPFVGMTAGLWKDPDRYLDTYWKKHAGVWNQGDRAVRLSSGEWRLTGRSDDRIKVAGHSVMPDEVESIVEGLPTVAEAVAIGIPDDVRGEALVVLLVPADGSAGPDGPRAGDDGETPGDDLVDRLTRQLGPHATPRHVHRVRQLPKTPTGKLMRQRIRAAYLGLPPSDAAQDETGAMTEIAALRRGRVADESSDRS